MPPAADILNDPDIAQAYEDVRSDKSDTTWLILKVREKLYSPDQLLSLLHSAFGRTS